MTSDTRSGVEKPAAEGLRRSKADRAKRQSELLDEALCETFPASDPVSVYRVE